MNPFNREYGVFMSQSMSIITCIIAQSLNYCRLMMIFQYTSEFKAPKQNVSSVIFFYVNVNF